MQTKNITRMTGLIVFIIFLNLGALFAAIPAAERAALIALYNSTGGDYWINNSGWKTEPLDADGFAMAGTENDWNGVMVSNSHVWQVFLPGNNLRGTIPSAIGDLQELTHLYLYTNLLSGTLPAELGALPKLYMISISNNQLTGAIPAEFGNLQNLRWLSLSNNKFGGSLPAELGNIVNLIVLSVDKNKLSGQIPSSLMNLTSLRHDGNHFQWNALYTNDENLRTFLNGKQENGNWESTQTIAPANVKAEAVSPTSILVSWDPIVYTVNTGGYRVFSSTNAGGPYTELGITSDKSVHSMTASGLTPGKDYHFVVETQTNPHSNNRNTVVSTRSSEVCVSLPLDPVKFSATPLVAAPGENIQFTNNSGGEVNRFLWDFGDGSREGYRHGTMSGQKVHPNHSYAEAGDYTVTLSAFGWEENPSITLCMPNLICIDSNYIPLAVFAGSETHAGYGWSKIIDHDVFSTDGKMTADLPDVKCVYSFADSSIRNVNRVRLFIDDVYLRSFSGHLTGKFEVWVSVDNETWTQALASEIPWHYRGRFASFTFPPVLGRYVKLKLTEPHNPNAEIIQLTEFQVFGVKGEDEPLAKDVLANNSVITEFELAQNYPNPFNPTTTISFGLPEAADVSLRVFNVTGRMVAELVNGRHEAGTYRVVFDAGHLSSGIYFSVMHAAGFDHVSRMILMK